MGQMVSDDKFEEQAARNGGIIKNGREILFQAFNWESNKHNWWSKLEEKVTDLAESGFTSAWLPPPTQSLSREGYLPQNLYCLDSCYGSLSELKSLLHKMNEHNLRAMADVVINHRIGTTQGSNGMYNRYDGIPISWDEHAVTSCSGGKGNKSTGDNFDGVPNIDHTQTFVRKDIIEWLIWLRRSVGFQDFRFDFTKGYAAKFVKEYIEESKPLFAVGEYWDSCEYSPPDYRLNYNQDNHRQRIINWIDSTGGLCAAFDFTTKGILQEAVKGELWRLRDPEGKPPGVMGWWPSRSVTFIENHDTGSTQGHWPFPSDHIMEGHAYILTHPGIPAVFYDHFYDQGLSLHDEIAKLEKHILHRKSAHRAFVGCVQTSVVGLSHRFHMPSDAGSQLRALSAFLGKCRENMHGTTEVILKRNTNIPADANAVSVLVGDLDKFSEEGSVQLGFLPREVAKWVAPLSDSGLFNFSGFIYPREALEAAFGVTNTKVQLLLYVSKGPEFSRISGLICGELIPPLCSLIASVKRCLGLWRLEEVLSNIKWPETLETDFIYSASSIGTSINPQFIASFASATGKRLHQDFDSQESDPEWGCWTAKHELKKPSISLLFPTIDRVKKGACGIQLCRSLLSLPEKTWQRLRSTGLFHDAIPQQYARIGHPMHVKAPYQVQVRRVGCQGGLLLHPDRYCR